MINVILNCFKKLVPGSKTNYVSPSNDIVLVWFFLSLLLLLLSEACPDHNLCRGSELITGRCRLRNTTGISTWTIPLQLFADDTIVYLTITSEDDAEHLQEDLDKLAQWGEDWFMQFHPAKCTVLTVTNKRNPIVTVYYSRTITCSSDIRQVPGGYYHRQSELEPTHRFYHKQGE